MDLSGPETDPAGFGDEDGLGRDLNRIPLLWILRSNIDFHGSRAGEALALLAHDLFDSAADCSSIMKEWFRNPEENPVRRGVGAAYLNEQARRQGPRGPVFLQAMEQFGSSSLSDQAVAAVALEGLYHTGIMYACVGRIRQAWTHDPASAEGMSAHISASLLASYRDRRGILREEAAAPVGEFIEYKGLADYMPAEALKILPSSFPMPEALYLEEFRKLAAVEPWRDEKQIPMGTPVTLHAQAVFDAVQILDSWGQLGIEGAGLLSRAWEEPESEGEIDRLIYDACDPSIRWQLRFISACRVSGRAEASCSRFMNMLMDDDVEGKLLASMALWNPRLPEDYKKELWSALRSGFADLVTSACAAYILGGCGDPEIKRKIGAGEIPRKHSIAAMAAYTRGSEASVPAGISAYANWRCLDVISFETYRYKGFMTG